jgi:fatty acid desaturase
VSHVVDPQDGDRIVVAQKRPLLRWRLSLTWFMRLMAVIWLAKGFSWWAEILGISAGVPFEERRLIARAIAAGFAVTDLIAAVGMWLTTVWGGLIWMLSVVSAVTLSVALPRVVSLDLFSYVVHAVILCVYFGLTALAAGEERRN